MPSFFELLEERVRAVDSLLCVGLDPHPADLSENNAAAARDFCLRLIAATHQQAAAYKPNAAFFEAFGAVGVAALSEVIQAVPKGIPVILDAKRGDIASTADAYAQAAFQALGADALTASPYLGYDSIEPFLRNPEKGVFLLCKTSNPGSSDLQDLLVNIRGETMQLFEQVARRAQAWNRDGNLGLVVGATHPDALAQVRSQAPDVWILAPGIGAQGGDLDRAVKAGIRQDGMGLLVPVSRGISRAENPTQAAEMIRQAINLNRNAAQSSSKWMDGLTTIKNAVAQGLLDAGCVKFGSFTLKSGLQSPIYIDLRRLAGYPKLLEKVAAAYLPILSRLNFKRLAALPYAALPIGTAISLQGGYPMIYPRREVKEYGTRAGIEGVYEPGERIVVIDDLATTGGSKFEAVEKLEAAGLEVQDIVVLIDRQSGAAQALAQSGKTMHAVFTLSQLLDIWERQSSVSPQDLEAARIFIAEEG